jgi:hypothetical protein
VFFLAEKILGYGSPVENHIEGGGYIEKNTNGGCRAWEKFCASVFASGTPKLSISLCRDGFITVTLITML